MKVLHPRPDSSEESLSVNGPRLAAIDHSWQPALLTFVVAATAFMLVLVVGGLAIMIAFAMSRGV